MKKLKFDFNNMFSACVGERHGVNVGELLEMSPVILRAQRHLAAVFKSAQKRVSLGLEWTRLPYQDKKTISGIQKIGRDIAAKYENVISLGIGGSYLGLKSAQDALGSPYHNEFGALPRIYFEGNNLDPETLSVLIKNLDPKKTCCIVISKSGETTETKAAFMIVEEWLKKAAGKKYGRQIFAVTDPDKGSLRKKVNQEQLKDPGSFRSLPLLKGVGGRFSELNMGLLHLAIMGISLDEVLAGARSMSLRCRAEDFFKNPALLYAALQVILYREKNKPITIVMPFSEMLKSTADWYCQLLAESTGKKYARKIKYDDRGEEGGELWENDLKHIVNLGRTPVASRGTNDLHSIQQNNIEGQNDKVVTFIRVEKFKNDIKIKVPGDLLSGKSYSGLLSLAQEATEWALTREERPNCTVIMPELTPFSWGELIFFFEMAVAYEGELLNINAFDQPGVESYKNYMYYKLGKAGLDSKIKNEIRNNPLVKDKKFML